jgi:superfamily I DNA and/or RNA helicase
MKPASWLWPTPSTAAHNVILLGDPQQLAQVAQAVHPNESGRSGLEHVLADHATMPADRGAFLSQTWRMHPDVCRFISEEIYEGRLTSHPPARRSPPSLALGCVGCARSTTGARPVHRSPS